MRRATPASERLWARVEKRGDDDCWFWVGALNRGYGVLARGGRGAGMVGAHRVAYETSCGVIPEGMHVRHKCDNPRCCNPSHLELGSHADNMRDMAQRERARTTRLTADQVREIRASRGVNNRALAIRYGVNPTNISMILRGHTWRHLEGCPDVRPVVALDPMRGDAS